MNKCRSRDALNRSLPYVYSYTNRSFMTEELRKYLSNTRIRSFGTVFVSVVYKQSPYLTLTPPKLDPCRSKTKKGPL